MDFRTYYLNTLNGPREAAREFPVSPSARLPQEVLLRSPSAGSGRAAHPWGAPAAVTPGGEGRGRVVTRLKTPLISSESHSCC